MSQPGKGKLKPLTGPVVLKSDKVSYQKCQTIKSQYTGTLRCSNCNTANTTLWRKFGDTGEYGCNSCVLYWKVNGVRLKYPF